VKTFLDLLDLKFMFLQQPLMRVSDFRKECRQRGLHFFLGDSQLEALHRAGLLVPMYRLQKNVRALRVAAHREQISLQYAMSHVVEQEGEELRSRRDSGFIRIHDPNREKFRPWSTYEYSVDDSTLPKSEFLFSPYQLLLVPEIQEVMPRMKVQRNTNEEGNLRFILNLGNDKRTQSSLLTKKERNDQLIVLLSALENIYQLRIAGKVLLPSSINANRWQEFIESFNPVEMLEWLEWDAEDIRQTAEGLLSTAYDIDPLRDWEELSRLVRPSKWKKLRGDALVAIDYKIAAETLLLFYEDLIKAEVASPLPDTSYKAFHPLQIRLKTDRQELDRVLMDYDLAPNPSLIIFLEGQTDQELCERVIRLLGGVGPRSFIEIRTCGLKAPIHHYFLHIAAPLLDEPINGGMILARHPTRFLVIFDQENAFKNEDGRIDKKKQWIDTIQRDPLGKKLYREDLEWLIQLETWDEHETNLEYAHFTNQELLDAMHQTCRRLGAIPKREISIDQVEGYRQLGRNIDHLLNLLRTEGVSKPSKTDLWEELWVILERKILAAKESDELDTIPVVRLLRHAYSLASEVRRYDVMIRTQEEEQ
jgi:hypothetical protein